MPFANETETSTPGQGPGPGQDGGQADGVSGGGIGRSSSAASVGAPGPRPSASAAAAAASAAGAGVSGIGAMGVRASSPWAKNKPPRKSPQNKPSVSDLRAATAAISEPKDRDRDRDRDTKDEGKDQGDGYGDQGAESKDGGAYSPRSPSAKAETAHGREDAGGIGGIGDAGDGGPLGGAEESGLGASRSRSGRPEVDLIIDAPPTAQAQAAMDDVPGMPQPAPSKEPAPSPPRSDSAQPPSSPLRSTLTTQSTQSSNSTHGHTQRSEGKGEEEDEVEVEDELRRQQPRQGEGEEGKDWEEKQDFEGQESVREPLEVNVDHDFGASDGLASSTLEARLLEEPPRRVAPRKKMDVLGWGMVQPTSSALTPAPTYQDQDQDQGFERSSMPAEYHLEVSEACEVAPAPSFCASLQRSI